MSSKFVSILPFLGIFLVSMLLVPPSMPYAIPEAEAQTNLTAAFIIDDSANGGSCTNIGTWNASTKTCTLTGDVNIGQTHGITIGSNSGITLDGGGYTLTGGISEDSAQVGKGNAGIFVQNQDNFVIKNLTISGFKHAVRTESTNNGLITGITTTNNSYGIDSKSDDNLKITNNVISSPYQGIVIWNGDGDANCSFKISQNTVSNGSNSGIKVLYGDDKTCIDQNTVSSSGSGIAVSNSSGTKVTNNTVNGNSHGISVSANSQSIIVTGNTANSNTYKGFYLDSSSTITTFTGNTALGNTPNFEGIGTPTLTITSFVHYNCDSPPPPNHNQNHCNGPDHIRYDVEGTATGLSSAQPLTVKITDSSGNIVRDYTSQATVGGDAFGFESPVFYNNAQFTNQYNDNFTITICAPELTAFIGAIVSGQ